MCLATNIRYLRNKKGYSQDYVAEKLGYKSFTTIQKWESGVSEPPIKALRKLAELFDIDIESLASVDLTKDNPTEYYLNDETKQIAQEIYDSPELKSLFDMSRKMTPERLKAHIELMKQLMGNDNN